MRDLHRCDVIFIVPSYHHGTMWEIQQIVENGLLNKTYFLIPILLSQNLSEVAAVWKEIFRRLESHFGLKPDGSLPFKDSETITDKQFLLRLEGSEDLGG